MEKDMTQKTDGAQNVQPASLSADPGEPRREGFFEKHLRRLVVWIERGRRYRMSSELTGAISANDMALDRTVMAADRTLMAWVRTAISLIGFGFTMFKFLEGMGMKTTIIKHGWLSTPRGIGVTLIALGMVCLIMAVLEYRFHMRRIGLATRAYLWSFPVIFALAFWIVGAVALVSVIFE
jgi:putative membrane protein